MPRNAAARFAAITRRPVSPRHMLTPNRQREKGEAKPGIANVYCCYETKILRFPRYIFNWRPFIPAAMNYALTGPADFRMTGSRASQESTVMLRREAYPPGV